MGEAGQEGKPRGCTGPLDSQGQWANPAWTSMMSGYDPGQLGIYGFRNRKDHPYEAYVLPNASTLKVDLVRDTLSRAGRG